MTKACVKCGSVHDVTDVKLGFARPALGWEEVKEQEGLYCQACYGIMTKIFSVFYKPDHLSKAEALIDQAHDQGKREDHGQNSAGLVDEKQAGHCSP